MNLRVCDIRTLECCLERTIESIEHEVEDCYETNKHEYEFNLGELKYHQWLLGQIREELRISEHFEELE